MELFFWFILVVALKDNNLQFGVQTCFVKWQLNCQKLQKFLEKRKTPLRAFPFHGKEHNRPLPPAAVNDFIPFYDNDAAAYSSDMKVIKYYS